MKKLLAAVALLAVICTSQAGCNSSSSSGDPKVIKIYSSLPRTGSAKAQTDTLVNGIRLALDDAGSKVGNFTIEYVDLDDASAAAGQWAPEVETANADRAVRDPDCMVYLGTYNSGAAKMSMPILNKAGLLMISPAASAAGLTKPDKGDPGEPEMYRPTGKINFLRVVPADDLQGPFAARWAKELGFKRVYILDDTEVYGKGIADLFEDECADLGIEVLGHDSIDSKAPEFRSLMTKIKGTNPDLVYFGGTTQSKGGQLAKDLVAAGLDAKFMVPDACMEQAFITAAGPENLNGRCFVTFGGMPPEELTGAGKEFVDKYQKRHNGLPEAYAIYGYEAAKVALEAIERAGKKDRAAILAAATSIKDFDKGALGKWSFDENGDTSITTISGSKVEDGKFEFVKVLGVDATVPAAEPAIAPTAEPKPAAEPKPEPAKEPAPSEPKPEPTEKKD